MCEEQSKLHWPVTESQSNDLLEEDKTAFG